MANQYIRKCELLVGSGSEVIDLSQLRIKFKVEQADSQTPNNAAIRVYNLSDATSQKIQKEFSFVSLQAGYENGNFGLIFIGTVKQIKRGREDAITTYLDIFAADGDQAYNFGTVNTTLAKGSTAKDQVDAIAKAMGVDVGYIAPLSEAKLPRGKTMYGMGRDHLRRIAQTNGVSWSINNGKIVMLKPTGYLPGTAVVLTSTTGMIGQPEQTEDGIHVTCLLNPQIKVGGLIQLNNASIQMAARQPGYNADLAFNTLPPLSNDGFYRVYVQNFEGDNRANDPWFSELTCLAPGGIIPQALVSKLQA